ncbi:the motor domain of kinesin family member 22 [Umbelopsis sp. PMI_123]|nr:the motor domain of kinesin family member 22 [Umbelopsis sp. PMI_123]
MSIKKNVVDEKVKVVCRVRPFLEHEAPDDSVAVEGCEIKITNQRNTNEIVSFRFSSCHGPEAMQAEIYEQDVQPMIDKVFSGVDSTIFAYGVTGSGKTHTMQGTEEEPGIIPRVAQYLFRRRLDYPKHAVRIHVSYMEIYKELVYDLLIPREGQGAGLTIREDSSRNIFVANLTDREITSLEEFVQVFNIACKNRSTASTKMNVSSSRSHAILSFQVTVAMNEDPPQQDDDSDTEQYALSGKINLIDLAGSEDNRRTDNGKERLAESGAINKSLFVLGQVVESINAASSRIPFRDSKMTRILQPSLGGKAQGMMIVNIAPGQSYFMDSYK